MTALLAFHVGSLWLEVSRSRPSSLPPPYQFFLINDLIAHAAPFAFLRFLLYAVGRRPNGRPSRRREPLTRLLLVTSAGVLSVIGLSLGIKVVDVVLHEKISSTFTAYKLWNHPSARAFVSPDCDDLSAWACPVQNRSAEASAGGRNNSSIFAVHEVPYSSPSTNPSIAYAGTSVYEDIFISPAPTVAIGSTCKLYRPLCNVVDEDVNECGGLGDPSCITYDTSLRGNQPQIVLTTPPNITGVESGTMGTSSHPFSSAGFMCFNDYSNLLHHGTDMNNTPYLNWGTMTGNSTRRPYILCFTFTCNSTDC